MSLPRIRKPTAHNQRALYFFETALTHYFGTVFSFVRTLFYKQKTHLVSVRLPHNPIHLLGSFLQTPKMLSLVDRPVWDIAFSCGARTRLVPEYVDATPALVVV